MSDTTRTILHSASKFLSGTALSRITGMLRDIALAYAFGTQSTIAALLVAFRLAHLLRRVLGEGAMQTALIPLFEEIRHGNPARGARFFVDMLWSVTTLLSGVVLGSMALLWGLLQAGFLSEGNSEIAWLTFLMMPSLLFICLFGINACLLQCERHFFLPSVAPVLFNIVWIIGIACTAHLEPATAVSYLALFIIAACLFQWLMTLPKTMVLLREQHGDIARAPQIKIFSPDVMSLIAPLSLAIVGVAATQINSALDAIFARWASPEGPAILWYALRLQQLPLALFGVALSGALLPPLARAAKALDTEKFFHFLDFATHNVVKWMVPITAMIWLFGDMGVSLIYGHGDFTAHSTIETTGALWGYGVGLVPMTLVLVYAPAFYASGDYKTPSWAATGAMVMNASLNAFLVGVMGMGAASVAVATSASALMNFLWLERSMKRKRPEKADRNYGVIVPTVLACAATMAFQWGYEGMSIPLNIAERVDHLFAMTTIQRGVSLALGCMVFSGTFFAGTKIVSMPSPLPSFTSKP